MARTKRTEATKETPPNGSAPTFEIHIECLTWEDMKIIVSADEAKGKEFSKAMVLDIYGLFDRIVEGGAKAVPLIYTADVIAAINEAMTGLGDQKNSSSA